VDDEVRIRPATHRDLTSIVELIEELDDLQAPWRVFPPRPELRDEVRERYRRAIDHAGSGDLLLVAAIEAQDLVVGTTLAHVLTPSSVSDEIAVELSGVIVRPSHRGRGIAQALAEAAARFARERGIRIVTLRTFAANEEALRFWERIGFRPRMVQMVAPAERLTGGPPTAVG
jgi:ribosomal protein S18 acetylase RimI-like enzyme